MNVDTGAFMALTAEVERMVGLVDTLTQKFEDMAATVMVSEVIYSAGRSDERNAILGGSLGRASRPDRHRSSGGSRPGHLSLAPDGRTS